MKTLILGGTGYVGRQLIPRLIQAGHEIRCLVRDPGRLDLDAVDLVKGDALDRASVETAVTGCDRIVFLIHSMTSGRGRFEDLDGRIAGYVAEAAATAGIKQIVYLGALGNKDSVQSSHLRSRHEVAAILRSGGVPVTELRAAVIIGAGSASFEMIRSLVIHLPVMICPRWVNVNTQPIAIHDVLEYLTRSLNESDALGKTLDIGGPDVLSYREMMLEVARQMNRRRLIIPVPVLTPWLSSHWVNLVTPISASLSRALIESVRSETVCTDHTARALFDFSPQSFTAAVAAALEDKPAVNAA